MAAELECRSRRLRFTVQETAFKTDWEEEVVLPEAIRKDAVLTQRYVGAALKLRTSSIFSKMQMLRFGATGVIRLWIWLSWFESRPRSHRTFETERSGHLEKEGPTLRHATGEALRYFFRAALGARRGFRPR